MRLSSTGRNDTDDFFALFLIESMDDQQNRTGAYGSNGYPPLLIFRSEVALGKSIGIIKNELGRFKANIVLAKVLPVFLFIPLKSHNLVATTTAYGLFLHVSIHLYVHRHRNTSRGPTDKRSPSQAMSFHLRPRISLTRSPKHIATMHMVRKGSGMFSSTLRNSSTESAFGSLLAVLLADVVNSADVRVI